MKNQGYSGASFKTSGNWIIPFLLGWSKSIVSYGSRPIGLMYTIHITPYINIGVNNPKPKYKPSCNKPTPDEFENDCDCGCSHCCCDEECITLSKESKIAAQKFIDNVDHDKIIGVFPSMDEDGIRWIVIVVDDSVEVPTEFDGIPVEKRVESPEDDGVVWLGNEGDEDNINPEDIHEETEMPAPPHGNFVNKPIKNSTPPPPPPAPNNE